MSDRFGSRHWYQFGQYGKIQIAVQAYCGVAGNILVTTISEEPDANGVTGQTTKLDTPQKKKNDNPVGLT